MKKTMKDRRCGGLNGILLLLGSAGATAADQVYVCTPCPAGKYSDGTMTECAQCPSGKYCPVGTSTPQTCSAGQVPNSAKTACTVCGAGTYATAGMASCTACPAGTYQSGAGQSGCAACPAGQYQNATGQSGCAACPAGYYCPSGSSSYYACSSGQVPNSGRTACTWCGSGTYYSGGSCTTCPSNATCSATGFTCNTDYYKNSAGTGCFRCKAYTKGPISGDQGYFNYSNAYIYCKVSGDSCVLDKSQRYDGCYGNAYDINVVCSGTGSFGAHLREVAGRFCANGSSFCGKESFCSVIHGARLREPGDPWGGAHGK
jgi:hypothetical protein